MQALDLKLLRDFKRLWSQALAISLVLACGVAILLTTMGTYNALEETRRAYYERNRFADIFAPVRRAPVDLVRIIRAMDGVRSAEARISNYALVDMPGRAEPVTARVLSLPSDGSAQLNIPLLRQGRLPQPGSTNEALLNKGFADANGLRVGDRFRANLNGRMRELTVAGTALSPEFIYTIGPGSLMPDNETFGVIWMSAPVLRAAFDMEGAFNDITLSISAEANEDEIIDQLDELLKPYGAFGAYGRDEQISNSFIESELQQQKTAALILPPIFYAISAFLVSMVIGRIVSLERNEIGLLKAVGYSNIEVCGHYLYLAGLIAVLGVGFGWVGGTWLSRALAQLYARFFEFPFLIYTQDYGTYAISGVLAIASAALGALRSAWTAASMPPAVAMSPPAPPQFKQGHADRFFAFLRLSQPTMMILRGIMRWPVRSGATVFGMAMAAGIMVASGFFVSALDYMMETTFHQSNRQDAMLLFDPDIPETSLSSVSDLPGVLMSEGQKYQTAVLRNGHLDKRVTIEARRPGADLARIISNTGVIVDPPNHGILLSERLAGQLSVYPGDRVEVEFKGDRPEIHTVLVAGIVQQYVGLGAYMDLEELSRLLRQTPRISGANLEIDSAALTELYSVLKETPELNGLVLTNKMQQSFETTIRENVIIMNSIYFTIAVLMTVGTTYNAARIRLSERARELASMRILGFSRGEVAFILIGDTMLLALIAQPIGWLAGAGISYALAQGSVSDLYEIPLVLEPSGFARASLVVLASALLSACLVGLRLARLDLVQVMKTRE